MPIYNTTLLVAGVQLLIILTPHEPGYALSSITATGSGLSYQSGWDTRGGSTQEDALQNMIQAVSNNLLTGAFIGNDGCSLDVWSINNRNVAVTMSATICYNPNMYPVCCVSNKMAFRFIELNNQIIDLTNKLADLEKRTNYVENNRAWW